jgi:hypothetical protein
LGSVFLFSQICPVYISHKYIKFKDVFTIIAFFPLETHRQMVYNSPVYAHFSACIPEIQREEMIT